MPNKRTGPDFLDQKKKSIGQQVLEQRAKDSKAGKIQKGSRSYTGTDHTRPKGSTKAGPDPDEKYKISEGHYDFSMTEAEIKANAKRKKLKKK
tara:strand:+ start:251 stop:529 length:279 start_codon:yes stop_codon:yes gene_type:complete